MNLLCFQRMLCKLGCERELHTMQCATAGAASRKTQVYERFVEPNGEKGCLKSQVSEKHDGSQMSPGQLNLMCSSTCAAPCSKTF